MAKKPTVPSHGTVLCLVRHGDAGEPLSLPHRDRERPLTGRGRKQARRAGRALARMGLLPRDVWTSRLRRAQQTAAIAAKAADVEGRAVESVTLAPDAAPERTVRALREDAPSGKGKGARRAGASDVRWVVGHEPHLSRLLGHLTGAPAQAFRLSKGAVAVVELPRGQVAAGLGRLVALLAPEALRALRGR